MTDHKLYTSLSANTIMAKLTNHVSRTRLITSTDKHYSLESEDDFRSGCQDVSHQQQFFSELPSPGQSNYTNHLSLQSCSTRPCFLNNGTTFTTTTSKQTMRGKSCLSLKKLSQHFLSGWRSVNR